MPQADAKHRHALDQLARHGDGRLQLRRIARAIREHDRVGTAGEDRVEVAVVRQHLHRHTA